MPWFVDTDKCSGCGLCVDAASEIFQMDDNDEFAQCVNDGAGKDDEEALEARDGCPEEAIIWKD